MSDRVCPWWLGYLLVNPLRRIVHHPKSVLGPFVREGMTVLEPGCGMGYFTLELARMVGPHGRVIAVDLQPKMLDGLRRRAEKAGLAERIEMRLAEEQRHGFADLTGEVDLALALFMLHEVGDQDAFFQALHRALKPGGQFLVVEPRHHISQVEFASSVHRAHAHGFAHARGDVRPTSRLSVLLVKPDPNRGGAEA